MTSINFLCAQEPVAWLESRVRRSNATRTYGAGGYLRRRAGRLCATIISHRMRVQEEVRGSRLRAVDADAVRLSKKIMTLPTPHIPVRTSPCSNICKGHPVESYAVFVRSWGGGVGNNTPVKFGRRAWLIRHDLSLHCKGHNASLDPLRTVRKSKEFSGVGTWAWRWNSESD